MTPETSSSETKAKELLKRLIHGSEFDAFIQQIREAQLDQFPSQGLTEDVLQEFSAFAYQLPYGRRPPYGMISLMAAYQVSPYLKKEYQSLPLVQALWYASQEERSDPYPFSEVAPGQDPFNQEELEQTLNSYDIHRILRLVQKAIREDKAGEVAESFIRMAFRDLSNLGQKLIFVVKAFEYLESVEYRNADRILFPALHYLLKVEPDREFFELLVSKLEKIETPCKEFFKNSKPISDEEAARLERVVMYQYPGLIIENLLYDFQQEIRLEDLFQVILSAASQSLVSGDAESWLHSVHGVEFAHAAWEAFCRTQDETDKVHLVFMAALHVNQMVMKALDPHKKVSWDAGALNEEEITDEELEKAIENSEPERAAALAERLLEGDKVEAVHRALLESTLMNEGAITFCHDMSLCHYAFVNYRRASIALRKKYLVALAYFLAALEKDFDLYKSLSGTASLGGGA